MTSVLYECDRGIATITLNRPDQLNAVTAELFADLSEALRLAADPDVASVILTGAGRGFCTGADLKQPRPALEPGSRRLRQLYHPATTQLAQLDKPVIAAVNGPAVGAGLSLAAAADIRLAANSARFIPGFVDVGLSPDNGGSFFVERALGYGRAFYWLTTGMELSPGQALEWGFVAEVLDDSELLPRARELAALLTSKPGVAVPATKRLLRAARHGSFADHLEREAAECDLTTTHPGRIAARAAKRDSITDRDGSRR